MVNRSNKNSQSAGNTKAGKSVQEQKTAVLPVVEPVIIVGGFLSASADYVSWQHRLYSKLGIPTAIANIQRHDWLTTSQRGDYVQQVAALDEAVKKARQATGAEKVWLICHSAGGLVGRLWLGEYAYKGLTCQGYAQTRGIIFLGAPYSTDEPRVKSTVDFINEAYPGACYSRENVQYISLIGRTIYGKADGNFLQRMAYNSYKKVSPSQPEQWGDGIVTLDAARVPGAYNLTVDNVHHAGLWGGRNYGSPEILPVWGNYVQASNNGLAGLPPLAGTPAIA